MPRLGRLKAPLPERPEGVEQELILDFSQVGFAKPQNPSHQTAAVAFRVGWPIQYPSEVAGRLRPFVELSPGVFTTAGDSSRSYTCL